MRSTVIFFFFFLLKICYSCDRLNDISINDINFQIDGQGLHRTLKTGFTLSSKQRFLNCRLAYRYQVPRGAFLDSNTIGSDLVNHCFVPTHFDVEAAASGRKVADATPVYFHSTKVLRKVFEFEEKIHYPIHLRYHKPVDNFNEAIVKFEFPQIYIQCDENSTIFQDNRCLQSIEKIPCSCKSHDPKCEFLRINMQSPLPQVSASIPIASRSHSKLVVLLTLFFVFMCIIFIVYTIYFSKEKSKTE